MAATKGLAMACALALAVLMAQPVAAQQARALTVDVGYDRFFVPGKPVPVRVTVDADRLVSGRLVASWDGGRVTVALPVEVPGGSRKSFSLVLPPGTRNDEVVTVTLRDGKRAIARSAPARLRKLEGDELVGVLPAVRAGQQLPATVPLSVDAGTARLFPITEADVRGAPASVAALGTIAASVADLERLSAGARANLLRWVQAGGHLLVDAPAAPVPGVPDQWQPTSGRAAAGQGEVVLTGDAMARGRWDRLIEPTDAGLPPGMWSMMRENFESEGIGDRLARVAGLRIPDLGWLIGFLFIYVLLVGPVAFIALGRARRAELAWVVVPLAALVFTSGAYGAGISIRNRTTSAHGTVVLVDGGVATTTSYLGLVSRGGGAREATLPSGWTIAAHNTGGAALATHLDTQADGVRVRLPLAAGQFAVLGGTGPSAQTAGLEVTATEEEGLAKGTVRNATDKRLGDVIILPGLGAPHAIGTLAPGEERAWSAALGLNRRIDGRFRHLDPEPKPEDILFDFLSRAGPNHRRAGHVIAAGWIAGTRPPIEPGGRVKGATAIVSRVPIAAGAKRLGSGAIERLLVRAPDGFGGDGTAVARFRLPAGAAVDPATVVLRSPLGAPLEVWVNDHWQRTDNAGQGGGVPGGPQPRQEPVIDAEGRILLNPGGPVPLPQVGVGRGSALPPGSIRDGLIWVRSRVGFIDESGSNLPTIEVR